MWDIIIEKIRDTRNNRDDRRLIDEFGKPGTSSSMRYTIFLALAIV